MKMIHLFWTYHCCPRIAPPNKNDPIALATASGSINRNEVLSKLLLNADAESNSHLQPNDPKHNIKVAFAEGYLAANNTSDGKTGYASRFIKVSDDLHWASQTRFQFTRFLSDVYASSILGCECGPLDIIVLGIEWLHHKVGWTHIIRKCAPN